MWNYGASMRARRKPGLPRVPGPQSHVEGAPVRCPSVRRTCLLDQFFSSDPHAVGVRELDARLRHGVIENLTDHQPPAFGVRRQLALDDPNYTNWCVFGSVRFDSIKVYRLVSEKFS